MAKRWFLVAIFITDLDGTLLAPYNTLSKEGVEVIQKARQLGHSVYFATGRNYNQVSPILIKYGLEIDGVICLNGAYVKEMLEYPLPLDFYSTLKQYIPSSFKITCHTLDRVYQRMSIKQKCKQVIKVILRYGDYRYRTALSKLDDQSQIYKVEIQSSDLMAVKQLYQTLQLLFKNQVNIVLGSRDNIEITALKASKLDAIIELMEMNHYLKEEIYVFGDSGNDASMLKYFENSYAPVSAMECAKKVAQHTCLDPKQDGVIQIIKQVIDQERKYKNE